MNRDFSGDLIKKQAHLAINAGLTDAEVLRLINSGSGDWLRGVAKRVIQGDLPEAIASNLIAARSDALSWASKLPALFLLALALPLKAWRVLQ